MTNVQGDQAPTDQQKILKNSRTPLFSKLKMKLKGRFETVPDIKVLDSTVLDSMKENNFHGILKCVRNDGKLYTFPRILF
jgi:hypothetical protein